MSNTTKGLLLLGVCMCMALSAIYAVGGFEGVVILLSIIIFVGVFVTGLHLLAKED